MKFFAAAIFFVYSSLAYSGTMVKIMAIGSSPKGQYVAFEEFGYLDGATVAFSRIRIKNVWKNRYVSKPFKAQGDGENVKLEQVRAQALRLAKERLLELDISS